MSLLSSLFGNGRGGAKPSSTQSRAEENAGAIKKLQDVIEMLEKKHEFLERKMLAELTQAKKLATKNKSQALIHLQRKKRYEKQIGDIDGQRDLLEAQVSALQEAAQLQEVSSALDTGHRALKNNIGNVDKISETIDDAAELLQDLEEIKSVMNGAQLGQQYDKDELWDELQAEMDSEPIEDVTDIDLELPSVPESDVPEPKVATKKPAKKQEAELDDLLAWAN